MDNSVAADAKRKAQLWSVGQRGLQLFSIQDAVAAPDPTKWEFRYKDRKSWVLV